MRLWLGLTIVLLLLSGCSSRRGAIKHNKVQAQTIQKQQLYIEKLKSIITKQHKNYLSERQKIYQMQIAKQPKPQPTKIDNVEQAPTKEVELKKVEDNNYSADYMYPGAKKQSASTPTVQTSPTVSSRIKRGMSKSECIDLIGQVKFDKYTQMFGNEEASLKRCQILKTMQN